MVDLDEIRQKWLNQCGPCDLGMPEHGCTHPGEDYRPVMVSLVDEIERLAYERDQYRDEAQRLGEKANQLVRRATEERDRANEAARLSAEARDQADDLRKRIADQSETIADLERQRMERDAWAVRVCTEHNLYELPLDVEDEFGAIPAALNAYRRDMATLAELADKASAREEAFVGRVRDLVPDLPEVRREADRKQAERLAEVVDPEFREHWLRRAHELLHEEQERQRLERYDLRKEIVDLLPWPLDRRPANDEFR